MEFPVGVELVSSPLIMLLGGLSAVTKSYLLCRSDRHALA